jgi:hypothetical protein
MNYFKAASVSARWLRRAGFLALGIAILLAGALVYGTVLRADAPASVSPSRAGRAADRSFALAYAASALPAAAIPASSGRAADRAFAAQYSRQSAAAVGSRSADRSFAQQYERQRTLGGTRADDRSFALQYAGQQ